MHAKPVHYARSASPPPSLTERGVATQGPGETRGRVHVGYSSDVNACLGGWRRQRKLSGAQMNIQNATSVVSSSTDSTKHGSTGFGGNRATLRW